MKQLVCLLALGALLSAQDPGRDSGRGKPAIHFVRWTQTTESHTIYRAAWRALEPHFVGRIGRERLVDFGGDKVRAREYFTRFRDAALVVAFGAEAAAEARRVLPKTPVVEVSLAESSNVSMRVDRERFARLLKMFRPGLTRVAASEQLPGFAIDPGAEVAWVPEGGRAPAAARTVVTTAAGVRAALSVRPDPTGAGLEVAAQVVLKLRDGKPLRKDTVSRLRVTVDLDAPGAGRVPLQMLARADVVRRKP